MLISQNRYQGGKLFNGEARQQRGRAALFECNYIDTVLDKSALTISQHQGAVKRTQ